MPRLLRRLLAATLAAAPLLGAAADAPGAADCKPGDLPAATYPHRLGPLTPQELGMARTAWKYFENNTQPSGLANAVDNYPSTTMWDTASYIAATVAARELAWRVYRAQEKRFQATGTLTAVTEDHVDQAPYFVYGSVWAAGQPWAVVTSKGEPMPQLRTLS
ncbi:MAG TPA: DUF3131 domain-containing protein, partial [Ramlibacter sp.]